VAGLLLLLLVCGFVRQTLGWSPGEWLQLVPDCAFRALTGFPCPGCGMTQALLLLTELRFADAVAVNPAAPVLVGAMGFWLARPAGRQGTRHATFHSAAVAAALVALLLAWALRSSGVALRLPL
jgi:hypothetical protein